MQNYFITIFFLILLIYLVKEQIENNVSNFQLQTTDNPATTTLLTTGVPTTTSLQTTSNPVTTTLDTTSSPTITTTIATTTQEPSTGTTLEMNTQRIEKPYLSNNCPVSNDNLIEKYPFKKQNFKHFYCSESQDCSTRGSSQKDQLFLRKDDSHTYATSDMLGDNTIVVSGFRPAPDQSMNHTKVLDKTEGIHKFNGGADQIKKSFVGESEASIKKTNREYNKKNILIKQHTKKLDELFSGVPLNEQTDIINSFTDSTLQHTTYKEEIDSRDTPIEKRNNDIDIEKIFKENQSVDDVKSNKKVFPLKKIQHVWDELGISFVDPKSKQNDGDDLALNNRHILPNFHISMLNNYNYTEQNRDINDNFKWKNLLTGD
jgi:hypothetical protein